MNPGLMPSDADAVNQSRRSEAQRSVEDNDHKRQDVFHKVSLYPNSSGFSVLFIHKYYTLSNGSRAP